MCIRDRPYTEQHCRCLSREHKTVQVPSSSKAMLRFPWSLTTNIVRISNDSITKVFILWYNYFYFILFPFLFMEFLPRSWQVATLRNTHSPPLVLAKIMCGEPLICCVKRATYLLVLHGAAARNQILSFSTLALHLTLIVPQNYTVALPSCLPYLLYKRDLPTVEDLSLIHI